MPALIDWRSSEGGLPRQSCDKRVPSDARLNIVDVALINNMPDAALEKTERQFVELLNAGSRKSLVRIKLFSLPEIARSPSAQQLLRERYFSINELWNGPVDAVIVTGTEPRSPNLKDEPYWQSMVNVLEWARQNTLTTIFSCLATHAAVLQLDGIARRRLSEKCFGLFDHTKVGNHPLIKDVATQFVSPHSRWNELPRDSLKSCGYDILTASDIAGVDMFVKQTERSHFVFFQGHLEYDSEDLPKEYRRDVGRFLKKERETYPNLPSGYFETSAEQALADFRRQALACPREELLSSFPSALLADQVITSWQSTAICIYRNWLSHTLERKAALRRPPRYGGASLHTSTMALA